jgi:hypothetical protein
MAENYFNVTPGKNHLSNVGVWIDELSPFVFQQLKKDCLEGKEKVEKNFDIRSGDILQMFHQDMPKDVFFHQPTKSKKGLETEVLRRCQHLCTEFPEYMEKLSYYSKMFDDGTPDFQLFIERCWINYQRPGEFIPIHQHSGIFSFVVWVSLPEHTVSKNSEFDLRKGYQGEFEFAYTDMLGQIKTVRMAGDKSWEGKICVFPAGLHHQVYPHYQNELRITVSGNIRAQYG